ncbi:MAG: prepilin-type N-terminal cleavage/methylation domain-containing protein, partial [Phycisphaera sp. TMED9]
MMHPERTLHRHSRLTPDHGAIRIGFTIIELLVVIAI